VTEPNQQSEATRQAPVAAVVALCLVQMLLILDMTVIGVAVPVIQVDLQMSGSDTQWVASAYMLTFGGLLALSGRLGDLFGQRRLLLTGLGVFVAASVWCGIATSGPELFAARAVQGMGAAMVSPAALALLNLISTTGSGRNRAIAWWSFTGLAGAALGQVVGGLVTDAFGWRWVFLLNLPVGLVAGLAVAWLLPRTQPEQRVSLDVLGALTLTGGLAMLVFTLTRVGHGADVLVMTVSAAVTVVLLAAFVIVERRHSEPLVPLSVFAEPGVRAGNVINLLSTAANLGVMFYVTFYMMRVLGYSAADAGLAYVPITLLMAVITTRVAWLIEKVGARALLLMGTAGGAAGSLWFVFAPGEGSYLAWILPPLLLIGVGAAFIEAPAIIVATGGLPERKQGLAAGLINTSEQVGPVLGLTVAVTAAAAIVPVTADAAPARLLDHYHVAFGAAVVMYVLAGLATFLVPRRSYTVSAPEPFAESAEKGASPGSANRTEGYEHQAWGGS